MPASYDAATAGGAAQLLRCYAITDIHITDVQSPAQAIFFGCKGFLSSAYSGVIMYTHHVLDGKHIDPDSGVKGGAAPEPRAAFLDAYEAAGLDKSIPWYQTRGNHDHFFTGFRRLRVRGRAESARLMTPGSALGQSIAIPSVPNLSDVGGLPTRDGRRVRAGLSYRSTALDKLTEADSEAFAVLGIRTVYDLRTAAERTAQPDRLPAGTEYVVIDVFKDSADAAPAQLLNVMAYPQAAEAMLGGGRALPLFESGYRELVSLPSACAGVTTACSPT